MIWVFREFFWIEHLDEFSGRTDLEFAATGDLGRIHGVDEHLLYESRIYLIVRDDDFLASRETVSEEDLNGRTLMVGGGSPPLLKNVQQRIIQSGRVRCFNSNDHDTTLVNVASGRGVCLAPGLLNGDDPHYKWIPFDCPERFECALLSRSDDGRESVAELIRLFEEAYRGYGGPCEPGIGILAHCFKEENLCFYHLLGVILLLKRNPLRKKRGKPISRTDSSQK